MKYDKMPSPPHQQVVPPQSTAPPSEVRSWEDDHIWQLFRHYSRTFSFATRILPRDMRLPIATLYFYCRSIDNIADSAETPADRVLALENLHAAREALTGALAGRPDPSSLLWRRLAELHETYTLHTPPLYELIEGAEWDLRGIHIRDEDDLDRYSNLVAGSIGAMMLPFLVEHRSELPQLEAPARALGMAMQITNILRDVGEDARQLQRVYLPESLLRQYGLEHIPLNTLDRPPEGYAALMEDLMQRAEAAFDEGMAAIPSLKRAVRPGIDAAARIYREILNEIRARGYDNLSSRAYTSRLRKLQVLCVDAYVRRKHRLQAKQPSLLLTPPA